MFIVESDIQVYTENGYENSRAVTGIYSDGSSGGREFEPLMLDGSPDCGSICVVTAAGSSYYMNENGELIENSYEVGPVCGRNLQSALLGLWGRDGVKRELTLESCRIYEIGKDYSDELPEDILHEKVVEELFRKLLDSNGRLDDSEIARDYIAELTEFDEQNPTFTKKLNSPELKAVAQYLIGISEKSAIENAPEGAKLVSDPSAYETLKSKLAKTFTTREIKILEGWTRGETVDQALSSKALALAPKFSAKVSFFAKLFGKK